MKKHELDYRIFNISNRKIKINEPDEISVDICRYG